MQSCNSWDKRIYYKLTIQSMIRPMLPYIFQYNLTLHFISLKLMLTQRLLTWKWIYHYMVFYRKAVELGVKTITNTHVQFCIVWHFVSETCHKHRNCALCAISNMGHWNWQRQFKTHTMLHKHSMNSWYIIHRSEGSRPIITFN